MRRLFGLALLIASTSAAADEAADGVAGRIGKLSHSGFRNTAHCTAFAVPGAIVTAAHCLPGPAEDEVHVLLGYGRGAYDAHVSSHAADWRRPRLRDLAILCRPDRTAGLPFAETPVAGRRLTVSGYGAPSVHLRRDIPCRVIKEPAVGLLHLDCPVPPGTSGAPVLDGGAVAGAMIARSARYSVAELLTAGDIADTCGR